MRSQVGQPIPRFRNSVAAIFENSASEFFFSCKVFLPETPRPIRSLVRQIPLAFGRLIMAPLPFQFLCALGQDGLLCASRGDTLYTFGADCALIAEHSLGGSSATGPEGSSTKEEERNQASQNGPSEATPHTQGAEEEVNESATPPPKRRKVDSSVADVSAAQPAGGNDKTQTAKGGDQKKKKKAEKPAEDTKKSYVILLKATGEGSHVVAVTGDNKTVHVLKHDGKGRLTGLSQR